MNEVAKLIKFRNYMLPLRDQFINLHSLKRVIWAKVKELREIEEGAVKKRKIIYHLSLMLFLYGIIGVSLGIVDTYNKDDSIALSFLYEHLYINNSEYIASCFSILYFTLANSFLAYVIHRRKAEIQEIHRERAAIDKALRAAYKEYDDPPVVFELSMPDSLTELIKYLNNGCSTIDESIKSFSRDVRKNMAK